MSDMNMPTKDMTSEKENPEDTWVVTCTACDWWGYKSQVPNDKCPDCGEETMDADDE